MGVLVSFFFELCLLRRTPQELPFSTWLLALAVLASMGVGLLFLSAVGFDLGTAFALHLIDIALLFGVLWIAFSALGKRPRFVQTATALFGSFALLGVLALLPVMLFPIGEEGGTAIDWLLRLAIVAWRILVSAHIIRHAFNIALGQAALVTLSYELLTTVLVGGLIQTDA